MNSEFLDWINENLQKRGWTRADLARRTKISQSAYSMIFSGQREPGNDVLSALAKVFDLDLENVFRIAGILPAPKEWSPTQAEWDDVFDRLSPQDQEELLQIARLKLDRQHKSIKVDTSSIKTSASGD